MRKRPPVVAQRAFRKHREELLPLDLARRFQAIHETNMWGATSSHSGLGSERKAVQAIADALPELCSKFEIKTLIDAPCGEGDWISELQLPLQKYVGLDIVPSLVAKLQQRHRDDPLRFYDAVDLTVGPVVGGDLILCRDCLVHLSFANINRVMHQFRSSQSTWFLTTHFTEVQTNSNAEDGDWRPLNFTKPPFKWPQPEALLNEECDEMGGAYSDKCLALWRLAALPSHAVCNGNLAK